MYLETDWNLGKKTGAIETSSLQSSLITVFITSLSTLLKPAQHKTVLTTKCSENLLLSLLAALFYFSSVLIHFPKYLSFSWDVLPLWCLPRWSFVREHSGNFSFPVAPLFSKLLLISLIPCTRFTSQEEVVVLTCRECSHAKERGDGAYHFCSCLLPPPPHGTTLVKGDLNRNHKWPPTWLIYFLPVKKNNALWKPSLG